MVDDAAIDLLGHAEIVAAVARFHVEDRDLAALGGDRSQAAIGIAEDQDGVRRFAFQNPVGRRDDLSDRLGTRFARRLQKQVRSADAELLE